MRSLPKLISRFMGILLVSVLLLLCANLALAYFIGRTQTASGSPYTTAKEAGAALVRTEEGYSLPPEIAEELFRDGVWAMLIEDSAHKVIWHTENLPGGVPREYSLADVSELTLGYIDGCTTYAGRAEDGLLVLGYPHGRYWKSMWPTWDYDFITNLPRNALTVLAVNVVIMFLIYAVSNSRLMKSVRPIAEGIQALPAGDAVHVREKGPLSELAKSINRTSDILQNQNVQLRRRERARANWIAGVSHDIRTPLSMVMGYAGQLENAEELSDADRRKAGVIVKQSAKMRDLINDLNLASKLEYDMQPVKLREENLVAIARQVAVDFINLDMDGKHPIEWDTAKELAVCPVMADRDLLRRAVGNLIQNSINHNEQGCAVHVLVAAEAEKCHVIVSDEGQGVSDVELERLQNAPHYMVCDENTSEQRHGLGLLLVRQIADAHGGETEIRHSACGGFEFDITLPLLAQKTRD